MRTFIHVVHEVGSVRRLGVRRPRQLRAAVPGPRAPRRAAQHRASTRSSCSSASRSPSRIAALLNTTGLRGRGVYRTLYFIPVVTMPAAIALVWRMIYNGDYGVLNEVLGVFGIDGRSAG